MTAAPPSAPFWGTALIEHGAELTHGYGWLPWALTLAGVLNGAAVLRAAGGIFLGLGSPPGDGPSSDEAAAETEVGSRGRSGVLVTAMAALIGACAGLALVPGLH